MMKIVVLLQLFLAVTYGFRSSYKLCVPEGTLKDTIVAIDHGEQVTCVRVTDSTDCAIRMAKGEVDFAVFNAEELLLAYQFYPEDLMPLFEIRHKDVPEEEFKFQSVALIPSSMNVISPGRGFEFLRNGGICLPGFSAEQWWNDHILTYFEKRTYNNYCEPNMTVVENDALNLKVFYGKACRPGDWSTDPNYSRELRKKYPELCSLCDDPSTCTYRDNDHYGHIGALDCLTSNRGKAAYVALSHARRYFDERKLTNNSYQFLCPDGSVNDLNASKPCAWIQQPWDVIVAAKGRVNEIKNDLSAWLNGQTLGEYWIQALNKLLRNDNKVVSLPERMTQKEYLARGREVDLMKTPTCGNDVRWCTLNDLETHKCEWVAKEALALGIEPKFTCHNTSSVFQCLRDIAENKVDIITIDSNYGHLARQVYNLSTVVYCDPEENKNSEIVAILREPRPGTAPDTAITSFKSLRDRTACFPEYGGIAWLSFINVARTNGLFSSKSCDYPKLVANYFSGACTPGIKDRDHSNSSSQVDTGVASKLCSVCPVEMNSQTICSASPLNEFYGDEGALKCLENGAGDVAFVEVKNLKSLNVDENRYRILCKNGSLSARPGFYFDETCALSATIDSEIVSRKVNSKTISHDITHALIKVQRWMGYRDNSPRPIRIFEKFNGTTDLLFEDNTSGMISKDSTKKAVLAYKDLFSHLEACSDAATMAYINLLSIIQVIFLTYLLK